MTADVTKDKNINKQLTTLVACKSKKNRKHDAECFQFRK